MPDPLQVGPAPTNAQPAVVAGKASLDPGVAWLSDFDAALAAGMALRVPIAAPQAQAGFDQLVVLGVKSTVASDKAAERLEAALDAHHFTKGIGFIEPGAATNATEEDRPPRDAAAEGVLTPSWSVERGDPLAADPQSDGARAAEAFGVPAATFDHVAGAEHDTDSEASWMNQLLWPATFGYFFWQIAQPLLTDAQRESVRDHFRDTSARAARCRRCASAASRTACCPSARSIAGSLSTPTRPRAGSRSLRARCGRRG